MLNPKVSILIPAYNAEKLVSRAIDSALAQDYPNFEVIIINDGSTDNTWSVLQKYQKKYPRKIKIFSQQNRGLGATRNTLIKKATGNYIINLDADDWLKHDYITTMITALKDGDIAIGGFERYDATYNFRDRRLPSLNSYDKFRFCTTASKMFRADFLRDYKLRYESINMGEDAFFNIMSYANTKRIVSVAYSGYCCYENVQSMTHTEKYNQDKSFYTLMQTLVERLNNSMMLKNPELHFYVFKNLLVDIFIYKKELSLRQLIKIYRQSVDWYKKFLQQNGARFRPHYQKGEPFLLNFTVNSFIISSKIHIDWLLLGVIKLIPVNIL